jgi:hypothetical protein
MPDLYSQATAYNSDGSAASTLGANARKVTRDDFKYGTPDLRLLMIVDNVEADGSWTSGYADPNSQLSKALSALQQRVEIYGVSNTDTVDFAVYVRKSSIPLASGEEEDDLQERTILSAAVTAAVGFSCSVYDGEIDGNSIDYND